MPTDGGQARLRITKTYKDAASYRRDGDGIVFERTIGLAHAAFVLPAGYRLLACNVPSQVLAEPDGRVRVSFMNQWPAAAPLAIRARRWRNRWRRRQTASIDQRP